MYGFYSRPSLSFLPALRAVTDVLSGIDVFFQMEVEEQMDGGRTEGTLLAINVLRKLDGSN